MAKDNSRSEYHYPDAGTGLELGKEPSKSHSNTYLVCSPRKEDNHVLTCG